MSSPSNIGTAKKTSLSKGFVNTLNPAGGEGDSASTMSGATLVQPASTGPNMFGQEEASLSDLMANAAKLPPEEFKIYMARYKQEAEARQEKQNRSKSWSYSKEFLSNERM
ncbi:hypothetical protein LTS07_000948 [Exophiala sideris]|uniref:Uncharacterized protein n=1 Tax=Exophiala sideris TaxID=1016849 RepID=A0ABR0JSI5_9EURO|nr:hypothetical protein LTS07_000948 [Exophiala sideris]KAK5043124.1 hypothetical protein LTR13_000895 [Exophiala sideris]KAK5068828.1 hypothetical protein LTR69_000949 [Exophiala sideris]KAK5186425.1 hypothetical protein LTR44_001481 [Eurotiomycetes sp. CCFEE 6388]